jgi:general secretion pathway protein L
MAKKFIGIDFDGEFLRVAVAEAAKGGPVLTDHRSYEVPVPEALGEVIEKALPEAAFGDRLALNLPAHEGFFRYLEFPFNDLKKIASALPLTLSSQIPVNDELVTDFLSGQALNGQFRIPAAAVRQEAVRACIAPFEETGHLPQIVDLAPFCYAAGLKKVFADGVLVSVEKSQGTVSLVENGQVREFRCHLFREEPSIEKLAQIITRDYFSLVASNHRDQQPAMALMGSGVSDALRTRLENNGIKVYFPQLKVGESVLAPAMLPAATLALRAAIPPRERQFNFLPGDLAPRGQWAGFRRQMITLGVILGLLLTTAAAGGYLKLSHLESRARNLGEEMNRVYRQTFPGATVIVDVSAQMQAKLAELREKSRILGIGKDRSALNLLREISLRTPPDLTIDVRELIYGDNEIRIEGVTESFEAINRLSQKLRESPLFSESKISDAKMSLDGQKVDFRLNLTLSTQEPAS